MRWVKRCLRFPFVQRARRRDANLNARTTHDIAICAIFREEAPFLDEWLTFHAGIGVSHFFLYNNFSTDNFREVLAPWMARGLVTLHDWPVKIGQLPAYRHCVRHYADSARWMAFIDIDEFLFSPQQVNIRSTLNRYTDLPALLVSSPYFGTSGFRRRPVEGVVASYTRRAPLSMASAKTIANPRWIYAIRNVHEFKYWAGLSLDTARRPLSHGVPCAGDVLRLNHYWSRSFEDLETKVRCGDASTSVERQLQWHLDFESKLNAEVDLSIQPIARAIAASGSAASVSFPQLS